MKGVQALNRISAREAIYKFLTAGVFFFFTGKYDSFAADIIESGSIKYENAD
jgi:hypothetical protein